MRNIDNIIWDVAETFSVPRNCYLVKITLDGREEIIADNITWDQGVKLIEEIMPTTKKGERLSLRERSPSFR